MRQVQRTGWPAVMLGITLTSAACGSGNTTTVTVTKNAGGTTAPAASVGGDATTPSAGSGSGSQLKVLDSGFSQYSAYGDHGINYAVLVKNTNPDSSFDQADVTVSFENAQGVSVASDEEYLNSIPAGQVSALVADATDVPAHAKVSKMVIEIGDPYNWQKLPPGEITGKVVSVHASNSYGTYEVKTTALFTSTFGQQLKDVDASVVYRDASGQIIGGYQDYLNVIPPHGKANHVFDDLPNFGGIRKVEVYAHPSNITDFG